MTNRRFSFLNIVTYLVAGSFVVLSLGPLLWLALTSLKFDADIVTGRRVIYFPSALTLQNYVELWRQTELPRLYWNTVATTILTILLSLLVGTPAAYAISRERFSGQRHILIGLLGVRVFPAIMLLIPLFTVMRDLGLLDTTVGLALAYSSFLLPMFIWLMKGFFDELPRELEDVARTDGCTRLQALWYIALPLVRSGLVAATALVAISAWNEFLFALILTTSVGSRTWPVGRQLMVGDFQLPWGLLAAGGIISVLPISLVFLWLQCTAFGILEQPAVKG